MQYRIAAIAAAIVHGAFIIFVVFGGLAVLRWPRLAWVHLPAAVWGVLVEAADWPCPLSGIENYFLRRAGRAGYTEGFVAHYLFSLIYPHGTTRGMEVATAVFVFVLNVGVYVRVFR